MGVDPLLNRVFEGQLRSAQSRERMTWGWLVGDERFPSLWDLNCAFVSDGDPSLGDIEAVLLPALRRTRVGHEHIQMFGTFPRLMADLEARGDEVTWDTWMVHESPLPDIDTSEVEEVADMDDAFWKAERAALASFGIKGERELDEYVAFEHLLADEGKRWFAIRREGAYAAMAAVTAFGRVSHVDNVLTFEAFRGRGFASALIARAVAEVAGTQVTLFTDAAKGASGLYERLGFRQHGSIPSVLRPLG